jgi:hypothetical protein
MNILSSSGFSAVIFRRDKHCDEPSRDRARMANMNESSGTKGQRSRLLGTSDFPHPDECDTDNCVS